MNQTQLYSTCPPGSSLLLEDNLLTLLIIQRGISSQKVQEVHCATLPTLTSDFLTPLNQRETSFLQLFLQSL